MPPPLPEPVRNLRDIRPTGNILQRLVINRHHRRPTVRLAVTVAQLQPDLRLPPRLVSLRIRQNFHRQHPLRRRHRNLPHRRVHFPVPHRERLHKHIRHVPRPDPEGLLATLPLQLQNHRPRRNPRTRPHKQIHRAVRTLRIDQQLHVLTRAVLRLLRHNLQRRKPIVPPILSPATNHKKHATFPLPSLPILHLRRNPILPSRRRTELHLRHPVHARRHIHRRHFLLLRLSLFVITNLQQRHPTRPLHALLIQRQRPNPSLNRLPNLVMPAIRPRHHRKRLPRH